MAEYRTIKVDELEVGMVLRRSLGYMVLEVRQDADSPMVWVSTEGRGFLAWERGSLIEIEIDPDYSEEPE